MNDGLSSQEQQELRKQVDEARGRLDQLAVDLHSIDQKVDHLRERRQLLEGVCASLQRLEGLGAAELFWGEQFDAQRVADQIREAHDHVSAFDEELGDLQKRRLTLVTEINRDQEGLEILSEDLYHAEEEEELRKNEWIVEREINSLPRRTQFMAWARGGEDDSFFRRSLLASLVVSVALGSVFPLIALPVPDLLMNDEALPRRLAQFIRQEQVRPTPPPPVVAEERLAEEEPDQELPEPPEPEAAEPPEPPDQPALPPDPPAVAEVEPPAGVPGPIDPEVPVGAPPGPPPRTVENTGILAFQDQFASLATDTVAPRLGADARLGDADDVSAASNPSRSMLTTNAPGSSGGIDLASLSRNVRGGGGGGGGSGGGGGGTGGGSGMPGVEVGRATSSIASIGGGDRPQAGGRAAGLTRTDEEIQIVFDRHKAEFYRFYNRELRNDPTLQGQMVLRLTIEPDGSVSMCELQSSDMNAPDLAAQVVNRVRTIDFGAKEGVQTMTIMYPIDFLPASEG